MLVRSDIPISDQLCQAAHAAHEVGIRFGNPDAISSIVVCAVDNEIELYKAEDRLGRKNIRHYLFKEPDLGNQATALATEPLDEPRRKMMGRYQLWKENGR